MSTTYHTPIVYGAPASSATINAPLGALDAALGAEVSRIDALANTGPTIADAKLREWVASGRYRITANTVYHATYGVLMSGTVTWPDETLGYFATLVLNNVWGAIDSYQITYPAGNKKVVQPTVSRGPDGNVTLQPQLDIQPV